MMRLAGPCPLPTLGILLTLVVLGCGQDGDLPSCRGGMALLDVTVIDGLGSPPNPGQTVLVCDGIIAEVAPTDSIRLPRGVQEVALDDRYIMPGMIDTRVSVTMLPGEEESRDRASLDPADSEQILRTLLAFGITTVRDPGAQDEAAVAVHEAVASGELLGPRIETQSTLIEFDEMDLADPELALTLDELASRSVAVAPTLISHRTRLRGHEARHRDHPELNLAPESVREAWRRVSASAVGSVEEVDQGRAEWSQLLALTGKLYESGVLLTTGTDFPSPWVIPGVGFHEELALLAEAGIPTLEVLKMATYNGAKTLGLDGEIGSVEVGKRADLVILTADPVTFLRNTRAIDLVLLGGKPFKPSALLSQASSSN